MARMRVIINKVISVVLYISLNKLTDWTMEVLPCSLADASNIVHTALPSINAPTVAMTKRNLCNIQDFDKLTLGCYYSILDGRIKLPKLCQKSVQLKWWGSLAKTRWAWLYDEAIGLCFLLNLGYALLYRRLYYQLRKRLVGIGLWGISAIGYAIALHRRILQLSHLEWVEL
jgi:hypothetical protein